MFIFSGNFVNFFMLNKTIQKITIEDEMALVPKHILSLKPYQAGKPIEEVQRELGLKRIVKLASNENPLGVSPKAQQGMIDALAETNRYPAPDGYVLRKTLAERYDIKLENVFLGHGSEGIISLIMRTFLLDDEEAITSEGSFIAFDIQAKSRGIKLVKTPLKDYHLDLDAMADRINDKTKIIYLANPNNPTGTIFKVHQFLEFINKVPEHCLVILDEAYFEFARNDPAYPDSMQYRLDNVITLRTFSKAFGLAGVRLGYGFAHESFISNLMKIKLAFEPSSLAIAAGTAAMEDQEFLEKTVQVTSRGRKFFYELFEETGIEYIKSHANFVTIILENEEKVNVFYDKMLRKGVIVRPLKAFGLPHCARISVGTEEENGIFAKALKEIL